MSNLLNNVPSTALSFQTSGKSSSCEEQHPQHSDQNIAYNSYFDLATKEYSGVVQPSQQNQTRINLRNTFISPELAYSNEKKKFFDKIGYNRRNPKREPHVMQQDERKQNNSQSVPTTTDQVGHQLNTAFPEMPLPQPKEVDSKFMRRRNKADDTFYERRLQTLSKIRRKKISMFDDGNNAQNSTSSVIKRLMTIRKQRQSKANIDQSLNGDEDSTGQYMTIIRSYKQNYNSRTEANATATGRDGAELNSSLQQIPVFNQVDQIDESISQEVGQGSAATIIGQIASSQGNFMSRRQLRLTNQKHQNSSQGANNSATVNGSRRKFKENSLENKYCKAQSFIINEAEEVQAVDRSMVNTASTFRGGNQVSLANRVSNALKSSIPRMTSTQFVPMIPGFSRQDLLDLFQAKCKDLKIIYSKDQMTRFFDIVKRNQSDRKLILADMGLGDSSVQVVSRILKRNENFSSLDLKKNFITNEGMKHLAKSLQQNTSIVHIDIGCNQISTEGAIILFEALQHQQSIVSISLGNADCYKNKNKIGTKAAQALGELLKVNQIIQFLNLADTSISQEGLQYIVAGLRHSPNIVSVNLSQNDIGSSSSSFQKLLTIFKPSKANQNVVSVSSLEELVLSQNQLTNRNVEDLGAELKNCEKTKLQRLDLSSNKLTSKAMLSIIHTLRNNQQLKLTHLTLDKMSLEPGAHQESQVNYNHLTRQIVEYLSNTRSSLLYLSLCSCSLSNDMMNAIGRGLLCNDKLETLVLRSNQIEDEGLTDIMEAFQSNKNLKLKCFDLSSNRLTDQIGSKLAGSLANANSVSQILLRDNNLGNESGEAFLFLVKKKKNLWKLQLDMNIIKYLTLMEIEKFCKRNKAYYLSMNLPEFKQQINKFMEKKDHSVNVEELDSMIKYQSRQIKEGIDKVINEEEEVHEFIQIGQNYIQQYDNKKKTLHDILSKQDELLTEIELQFSAKEKELMKKIEHEESLLARCKDYTRGQEVLLNKERGKVERRKHLQQADEEENKCRSELERIQREQQMLLIIVDNYQKEIERVKRKQAVEAEVKSLEEGERSRETSEERDKVKPSSVEKPGLFGLAGKKEKTYEINFAKDTNSFLAKKKRKQSKKKSNTNIQNTAVKAKKQSVERPKITKLISNLMFNQDVTVQEQA